MKKVIACLLMILVMASAFAESKTINVSLTVNEKSPRVAFTEGPYSEVMDNGPTSMERIGFGDLTETAKTQEFYASADTNSADPLTLKIYGTALTLKNSDSTYDGNQTVRLTLSVLKDSNNASESIPDAVVFAMPNTGEARSSDNDQYLTLIEDDSGSGSGVADVGFRALTWALKLEAEQAVGRNAGDYEAFIWLEVGSGPTGP